MSGEEQNLILFEKMAKKMIDGDFENFREATSLLTTWLSKRQAYYPSALLQIVRLLFIAQLRVRNEVKFNQALPLLFKAPRYSENPFAGAYINLVSAVLPFQDVFVEGVKGVREGYQQLIASISGLSEQETPLTLSPTPRPADSVESASRSFVPPPRSEATPTGLAGRDPIQESLTQSCTPNQEVVLEASKSAAMQTHAPTLLAPKQIESPCFVESKDDTLLVNLEAGERPILTDLPHGLVTALPQQIGITALVSKTPGVEHRDNDVERRAHTPNEQQQTNRSIDHLQEFLSSPLCSEPGASLPRSDTPTHSLQNLHSESLTGTSGVTEATVDRTPTSETFSTEQNLSLESAEVDNQMEVDPTEVQKPNEPVIYLDPPHSADNTQASVEINSNVHNGRNEAPSRGESDAMGVDELGSSTPTVLMNTTLKDARASDSRTLNHSMSLVITDSPPASVEMSIIARQQGLKARFRIFIDFDITGDRFVLIKKWSKRLGDLVELKSSLCVTLGCYLLADLKSQFETRRFSSFEQLLSSAASKWPQQCGSLSLKVISAESKEENLPLSPPFQVTPDNLLDISGLVAEGRNQIQLHQTTDLRHLLFVLHAHHPTRQQLEQVQHYLSKTKEWQQFLENFTAPFAYDSFTSLLCSQASQA